MCATTMCVPCGACCRSSGCEEGPPLYGQNMDGAPQGAGSTYATTSRPDQACCLPDATCTDLSPEDCPSVDGRRRGLGEAFEAVTCLPSQACCFDWGWCENAVFQDCVGWGGVPQGVETARGSGVCENTVACASPTVFRPRTARRRPRTATKLSRSPLGRTRSFRRATWPP